MASLRRGRQHRRWFSAHKESEREDDQQVWNLNSREDDQQPWGSSPAPLLPLPLSHTHERHRLAVLQQPFLPLNTPPPCQSSVFFPRLQVTPPVLLLHLSLCFFAHFALEHQSRARLQFHTKPLHKDTTMPPGAKKRKAAKRKEREQRQLVGVHPPGPPTSFGGGPPHSVQVNAAREEKENQETENSGDVTSPMEQEMQDNHHKQDGTVRNEDKIECDSTVLIDVVMDSTQNFGEVQPHESFLRQGTDEDAKEIEEVHVMAIEVKKDEVLPSSPLNYNIPHTTGHVSGAEVEAVIAEHIQFKKAEHVLVLGDGPSIVEHKKWEPVSTATLSVSEEDEQAWGSLILRGESAENVAETSENEKQERVLCLLDSTAEETDQNFNSHNGTKRHPVAGTAQLAQSSQLKQRTPWWNCCGLFDILTHGHT